MKNIENTTAAVHSIAFVGKNGSLNMVTLVSKNNEMSEEQFEYFIKHPKVKQRIDRGIYKVTDKSEPKIQMTEPVETEIKEDVKKEIKPEEKKKKKKKGSSK